MTGATRRSDGDEIPGVEDRLTFGETQARKDLHAFFRTLDAATEDMERQHGAPDGGEETRPRRHAPPIDARNESPMPTLAHVQEPGETRRSASGLVGSDGAAARSAQPVEMKTGIEPVSADGTPVGSAVPGSDGAVAGDTEEEALTGIERIRRAIEQARRQRAEAEAIAKSLVRKPSDRTPSSGASEQLTVARAAMSTQRHWLDEGGTRRRARPDSTTIATEDKRKRVALDDGSSLAGRPVDAAPPRHERWVLEAPDAEPDGQAPRAAEPPLSARPPQRTVAGHQPPLVLPAPLRPTPMEERGHEPLSPVPVGVYEPPQERRLLPAGLPLALVLIAFGTALSAAWITGVGSPPPEPLMVAGQETVAGTTETAGSAKLSVDADAPATPAPQAISGTSPAPAAADAENGAKSGDAATGKGPAEPSKNAGAALAALPSTPTVERAPAPVAPSSPAAIEQALAIDATALVEVEALLLSSGYLADPGSIGLGPEERAAIAAWQADRGLRPTGYLDMATFALMMTPPSDN